MKIFKKWAPWVAVFVVLAYLMDPLAGLIGTGSIWIIWTFFYQIFYGPNEIEIAARQKEGLDGQ